MPPRPQSSGPRCDPRRSPLAQPFRLRYSSRSSQTRVRRANEPQRNFRSSLESVLLCGTKMADCDRSHVIGLWRVVGVGAESLPECCKIGSGVVLRSIAEGVAQAITTEFVVSTEDLGEAIGVEKGAAARRKHTGFGGIAHARDHAQRCSGCAYPSHRAIRQGDERRIVTGVDQLNLVQFGSKSKKDSRHVAAASLLALLPVLLAETVDDIGERYRLTCQRPER